MTAFTLRLGDRAVIARVDPAGRVHVEDTVFSVTGAGAGLYVVTDGQRRWSVAVADAGEACWVSVNGRVAVLEVDAGAARTSQRRASRGGVMAAPMPATVSRILVAPGQAVAEGDTLLVLEAMKMELPVRAPRAGVVSAVRCAPGELVHPGPTLVDLD
jgi:biotin carboxyl carrier protein